MDMKQYMQEVRSLFESGKATPEQWAAMAECVLAIDESEHHDLGEPINDTIGGQRIECPNCGTFYRPRFGHGC